MADNRPDNIKNAPPHRVFFNWDVVYRCNYKCTYCTYTVRGWDKIPGMEILPTHEQMVAGWKRMRQLYGCCHVMMSGGEPSILPRFYELMEEMSALHTIELISNLSFDAKKLLSVVGPDKLRVAASLHLNHVTPEEFLEKALALKKAGVEVFINFVAYPPHLQRMKEIHALFLANDIPFYIHPFTGPFNDRLYPRDYIPAELELYQEAVNIGGRIAHNSHWLNFKKENLQPRVATKDGFATMTPPQSVKEIKPEPIVCKMGHMYAKILPDGMTLRCCAKNEFFRSPEKISAPDLLGNIFTDPDFKMHPEPQPCAHRSCPCDRRMKLGEESNWLDRWRIMQQPF
ncbi:MAG: radical SAM protein [Elusimicrobia bacterium]|nr:radical SAM protein [Elusimicrobiota bacterium]